MGSMSCGGNKSYGNSASRDVTIDISRVDLNKMRSASNNSGNKTPARDSNYNRQLENMSTSALDNILTTYRSEISFPEIPDEEKSALKSRISMIEGELSRRGKNVGVSDTESVSPLKTHEKKNNISSGVAISSLALGVIAFIGSTLTGSKHPFKWGFAGAGLGAITAFFLSQDSKLKLINPI